MKVRKKMKLCLMMFVDIMRMGSWVDLRDGSWEGRRWTG